MGEVGRKASRLLVLFLFIAAGAGAGLAQNRNTIMGFVFSSDRRPLSDVTVELSNEVYQVLQRARTDGSGRYSFAGLSSGRFFIKVLPMGTNFEEQTQEVEIVNIPRPGGSSSDSAFKDFYLHVRKSRTQQFRSVTGSVFAQEVPIEAKRLYEKGAADLEANRTEAGLKLILESIKIFPEYYAALERLSREYVQQGNYEFARAAFLKMVSVNERSFAGWYGFGFASYALKEPGKAIEAAKKAITLEQGAVEAHLLLGISQRMAKDYSEAEKSLLKAKELANGSIPDVHWNLALLYGNNMSKFKEAADELELYIKIAPPEAKIGDVKKLVVRFREKAAGKS